MKLNFLQESAAAMLLFCALNISQGTIVTRGDKWTHIVKLDPENGFIAKWFNTPAKPDGSHWIEMEISANTRGYVGLGFSPKGGMAGADIVIGWVDNEGKAHLRDFYGESNNMPISDEQQDYEFISGHENDDGTTIRFRRKWDTCDNEDMELMTDTTRLIWAFNHNDPIIRKDGSLIMNQHTSTNRGVQSVFLADDAMSYNFPDEGEQMDPSIKTWDMTMKDVEVSVVNTTYHCRIEKFTDTGNKHHLIGWKPIIQPENVKMVHHILFYECHVPDHLIPMFDEHSADHPGGNCYTKNMPPEWGKSCTSFLLVWTVGSEGEMLPNHVGAPLGQDHGGATYFMIEMHYENPDGRTFTDNSGIRIFYTDKLREHEGSVLLLGYRHSPFLMIPPEQDNFMINGVCDPECFQKTFPPTGIHIVTSLIHAHLYGKKLRLRHFRNGIELPIIAEDGYYDFNYQQSRTLKTEVTVLPGDELLTECEYDTSKMKRIVLGGLATSQEMCQTFLFYYPKVESAQCTSQSEFHDFLKGIGVEEVSGKVLQAINMPYDPKDDIYDPADNAKELEETGDGVSYRSVFDQIMVTAPRNIRGRSVGEHLRRMDWSNKTLAKSVEDYWKNGKHYQFCTSAGSKRITLKNHIVSYPKIIKSLEKRKTRGCSFNHTKRYITRHRDESKSSFSKNDVGLFATVALALFVAVNLHGS